MTTHLKFQGELHNGFHPQDIIIDARPADVWDALRDFRRAASRLVPGFVTDTKLDGDARIVTFANGTVAREVLVDCDDKRRRLVYAIKSERLTQHSASAQVFAEGESRAAALSGSPTCCRTSSRPYMEGQMELGLAAMQKSLGRKAA